MMRVLYVCLGGDGGLGKMVTTTKYQPKKQNNKQKRTMQKHPPPQKYYFLIQTSHWLIYRDARKNCYTPHQKCQLFSSFPFPIQVFASYCNMDRLLAENKTPIQSIYAHFGVFRVQFLIRHPQHNAPHTKKKKYI